MKKLTVVLSALAVIFLVLAILSASYSVSRTEAAIAAIGTVSYDEASKEKIDLANTYFTELDASLRLEERVANLDVLTAAKAEYVRLAIKTAVVKDQRKLADGYTDEEVTAAVAAAREALDSYFGEGAGPVVENYFDLIALEEQYAASDDNQPAEAEDSDNSEKSEEKINLC